MGRVPNEENKLALRKSLLSQRRAIARHDCALWSQSIQGRVLAWPAYRASLAIVLYSPADNEVDTGAILHDSLTVGRRVYFPRTGAEGLPEFVRVTSPDDLRPGRYNILEPTGTERLCVGSQTGVIVFVPGVAFDVAGNRLGRGSGWYDRMLRGLETEAVLIGLAYQFQIVERVPTEAWDRRVHYIVTENKLIDCDAVNPPREYASR